MSDDTRLLEHGYSLRNHDLIRANIRKGFCVQSYFSREVGNTQNKKWKRIASPDWQALLPSVCIKRNEKWPIKFDQLLKFSSNGQA